MTLEQYLREVAANSNGYAALRSYISEVNGSEVVIQFYPDANGVNPKSFKTSGTTIDEKIYTKS